MQETTQNNITHADSVKPYRQILNALTEYYFQNTKLAQNTQAQARAIKEAIEKEETASHKLSDTEQRLFNQLLTLLDGIGQDTLKEPEDFKIAVSRSFADYYSQDSTPKETCYHQAIEALNLSSTQDYIDKINEIIRNLEQQDDTRRLEAMAQWIMHLEKFNAAILETKDSHSHLHETFANFTSGLSQSFCSTLAKKLTDSKVMIKSVLDSIRKAADPQLEEAKEITTLLVQDLKNINQSVNEHKRSVEDTQKVVNDTLKKLSRFFRAKEKIEASSKKFFITKKIIPKLHPLLSNEELEIVIKWCNLKLSKNKKNKIYKGKFLTFLEDKCQNLSVVLIPDLYQQLAHLYNEPILAHKKNDHRLHILTRLDSSAESGYGSSQHSALDAETLSTMTHSSLVSSINAPASEGDSVSIKSQKDSIDTHSASDNNAYPQTDTASIAHIQRPLTPHQPAFARLRSHSASDLPISSIATLDKQWQAKSWQAVPTTLFHQKRQHSEAFADEFLSNPHNTQSKKQRILQNHLSMQSSSVESIFAQLEPEQKQDLSSIQPDYYTDTPIHTESSKKVSQSSSSIDIAAKEHPAGYRNRAGWLAISLSLGMSASAITTLGILIGVAVLIGTIPLLVLISSGLLSICTLAAAGYIFQTRKKSNYTAQTAPKDDQNGPAYGILSCQKPIGEPQNEPIMPEQGNGEQAIVAHSGGTSALKWASLFKHFQGTVHPIAHDVVTTSNPKRPTLVLACQS